MFKPIVLFLCTGNSARSQMAEALLRKEAGEVFDPHSAGTNPQGINPLTTQVMTELGIDIQHQRSKHLRDYLGRLPVSVLIVVCAEAENECPKIWPGVFTRLHWAFDDPAAASGSVEEKLQKFRQVRDQIHQKIKSWLDEPNTKALGRMQS